MIRLFALWTLGIAVVAGCSSSSAPKMAGPTNPLVMARPYDYDQPAGYNAAKPYPLIVLVHGFGANGFVQDALFGFNQLPDARGVFVAHPDGTVNSSGSRFWNATDACCDEQGSGVDDVAYLNAVVDDMEANFNIDKKRVFFVGHSNGAFMSHRMACDSAGRVAAIVALAGDVWQDASKCNPSEPVAVAQVHGDADTL
ncbi:MAG: alpha/beta fold hydrolase, partial [Myxococcales bacterium]|nr:alpha/beta fold hydrolase [Myxococcales bacterium]